MEVGPTVVVAKRGEYGAALFTPDEIFAIPGLLIDDVRDPTGAGDSFAGGFLGYLDGARSDGAPTESALRQAMAYGSVMASYNVEDFGTERVRRLDRRADRRPPSRLQAVDALRGGTGRMIDGEILRLTD